MPPHEKVPDANLSGFFPSVCVSFREQKREYLEQKCPHTNGQKGFVCVLSEEELSSVNMEKRLIKLSYFRSIL